ncbi:MAG: hypothetical protein WC473_04495 [Patescibacteria group bacterium]|jgi:hypothetical protein
MTKNSLKLELSQQTTLTILLVGLAVICSLAFLAYKFYGVVNNVGLPTNQIKQVTANLDQPSQPIDLVKLNTDYAGSFAAITDDFLSQAIVSNDLSVLARSAQDKLLALKVPSENKAKHLAVILALGEIGELSGNSNQSATAKKLTELKGIINQE